MKTIIPGLLSQRWCSHQISLEKILNSSGSQKEFRRGIATHSDPSDLLVLTQPTPTACVRVIDGAQPELSSADPGEIQLVASLSRLDRIITDTKPAIPPKVVFGPEPEHGWCYSYQKANLARQQGDWERVAELGETAWQSKLLPEDPVEYFPFLQAYAILERQDQLQLNIAAVKTMDAMVRAQYCLLTREWVVSVSTRQILDEAFCTP